MNTRRAVVLACALPVVLTVLTACTAILGVTDVPQPGPGAGDGSTTPNDSSTSSDGGSSETGAIVDGIPAYAAAECQRQMECTPFPFALYNRDVESCINQRVTEIDWVAKLPGNGVDDGAYRDCAAAVAAMPCGAYVAAGPKSVCDIHGSRADGEGCLRDEQCSSGYCPSVGFACATCLPAPVETDPCGPDNRCAAGLACFAGKCVTVAQKNEPCSTAHPCAPGIYCGASDTCLDSPAAEGAPCGTTGYATYCNGNLGFICPGESAGQTTCYKAEIVAPGGRCTSDVHVVCLNYIACTSDHCAEPPATGEPCDGADSTDDDGLGFCTSPEQCIQSRCAALPDPNRCP